MYRFVLAAALVATALGSSLPPCDNRTHCAGVATSMETYFNASNSEGCCLGCQSSSGHILRRGQCIKAGQTANGSDPLYTHVTGQGPSNATRFAQSTSGQTSPDTLSLRSSKVNGNYGKKNPAVESNMNADVQNRDKLNWFNQTHNETNDQYDSSGRLQPPVYGIEYNPSLAKLNCRRAFAAEFGNTIRTGWCKDGCNAWMAYSSLNWEASWRPKLLTRCKKQCLQRRKWQHLLGDKAKHPEHLRQDFNKSYWMERQEDTWSSGADYVVEPYQRTTKLPFYSAHHCNVNNDCNCPNCAGDLPAKCSKDHKLVDDDVDECINSAEQVCQQGCEMFKYQQCGQDGTACGNQPGWQPNWSLPGFKDWSAATKLPTWWKNIN